MFCCLIVVMLVMKPELFHRSFCAVYTPLFFYHVVYCYVVVMLLSRFCYTSSILPLRFRHASVKILLYFPYALLYFL